MGSCMSASPSKPNQVMTINRVHPPRDILEEIERQMKLRLNREREINNMIEDPERYGSLDPKFDPEDDVVLQSKHVSDKVKQIWRELGYFDYEEKPDDIQGILEYRPEYKYDNGNIYVGQWLRGTQTKHGKGVTIFKSGSV